MKSRPHTSRYLFIAITGLMVTITLAQAFISPAQAGIADIIPPDKAPREVHIVYIYSPGCYACEQAEPALMHAIDENPGVKVTLVKYEFNSRAGKDYLKRFSLDTVPAVIINNNTAIHFEDFGADVSAFGRHVKDKIDEAATRNAPVQVQRSVSPAGESTARVDTFINNVGEEPVSVNVTGGLCDGVNVVSGKAEYSGIVWPGGQCHLSYEAEISEKVKELPSQSVEYEYRGAKSVILGPETPVTLLRKISALTVFIAGVVAAINPCLLAVMAFIASMALSIRGRRGDIALRVLAFCAGLLAMYLFMGVGFLEAVKYIPSLEDIVRTSVTIILVVFAGYTFYDAYETYNHGSRDSLLKHLIVRIKPYYKRFDLTANFILGGAFGIIKMPCIGGIYIAILGMIAGTGVRGNGILYLLLYNLGLILPVVLLGMSLAFGLDPGKVDRFRNHHRVMLKVASGVILLLMAAGFILGFL